MVKAPILLSLSLQTLASEINNDSILVSKKATSLLYFGLNRVRLGAEYMVQPYYGGIPISGQASNVCRAWLGVPAEPVVGWGCLLSHHVSATERILSSRRLAPFSMASFLECNHFCATADVAPNSATCCIPGALPVPRLAWSDLS